MRQQTIPGTVHRLPLLTAALALALSLAQGAAAAPPPQGFTYFTLLLGLESSYAWEAECLTFTATEVCTLDGWCGTWERTPAVGGRPTFAMDFRFRENDVPVRIDGRVTIETRGPRESFGGAVRMRMPGRVFNVGLTARRAPRAACRELLRNWDVARTPQQPPQNCDCLARGAFVPPEESPYVLPYPVGTSYRVTQSYCNMYRSHAGQLAYDFEMPIGTEIAAARAGEVVVVREDLPDDSPPTDHNHVLIQHDDGTVAFYAHLAQNGALVELGERVEAGQVIALAAMSGTTEPHLHFGVYRTRSAVEGDDVAVTFRNADGPFDHLGALFEGLVYTALPYQ